MVAIYMDGSYSTSEKSVGFGVRVEMGDGIEHFGGYFVNPAQDSHLHEYFAFIEAADLARRLGLKPSQCLFITDYDSIVYGAQDKNGTPKRNNFLKQISRLRKYFRPDVFNNALVYSTARFDWQKGHSHCVNNRRVDYLATNGRSKIMGRKVKIHDYEEWIKHPYGKQCYTPFTNSYVEIDGQKYVLENKHEAEAAV